GTNASFQQTAVWADILVRGGNRPDQRMGAILLQRREPPFSVREGRGLAAHEARLAAVEPVAPQLRGNDIAGHLTALLPMIEMITCERNRPAGQQDRDLDA